MCYDYDAREFYGFDQPEFSEQLELNQEMAEDDDCDCDMPHEDYYPCCDDDDSEYDCDTYLYGEFYDWE